MGDKTGTGVTDEFIACPASSSTIAGNMLVATIHNGNGRLLNMTVVVDGNDLARVVPRPRILDLPVAACIVEILKELPYDPVVSWLHSLVEPAWVAAR